MSGGRVSLSFFVPSPIDGWFDVGPLDYSIGSEQSFDISTGLPGVSVRLVLRNTVETTPSLSGPASISPSELAWDSAGSKTLTISVSSNAKDGEIVRLSLPLWVRITADIKATVLGVLSLDLASFHLPRIQASPILTDELTVVIPDLTAAFVNLPTAFQEGTEYQITVIVRNIGTANAGQFGVELRANDVSVGTTSVSSLAADASTTVTFMWRPSAGQYTLRAVADSGNAVEEIDETNNAAIATAIVTAIPWLVQWWPVIVGMVIVFVVAIVFIMIKHRK